MVLIDTEQIFDPIKQEGLLFKMNHFNFLVYMSKIIQFFLKDRTFAVHINDVNTRERRIPARVHFVHCS